MKALIQRVKRASVSVGGEEGESRELLSEIGPGLLILLGVMTDDTEADADWLAAKCVNMRIFNDDDGVMNRSVRDVDGDIIVVSQFTLAACVKKGNRPSYIKAARHELAIPLYEYFCAKVSELLGKRVGTGRFGADMLVSLENDGPVTIMADSRE